MNKKRPPDPPDGCLNPSRPTSDEKTTKNDQLKMATSLLGQIDDETKATSSLGQKDNDRMATISSELGQSKYSRPSTSSTLLGPLRLLRPQQPRSIPNLNELDKPKVSN